MKEQIIDCSGRVVLECRCGERLILLGRVTDWYSEEHLVFRCECGEELTFDNRLDEEELTAGKAETSVAREHLSSYSTR